MPGLSFTAIDFETANAKRESVCAVGMTKVRDGVIVADWYSLVKPPRGYDLFNHFNIRVHGIRPDDVVHSPGWDDIHDEVCSFIDGDDLVAHNAPFDRSVYSRACSCLLLDDPGHHWHDTLAAARRFLTLPDYKLPTVVRALALDDFQHHHAAADARQAALVAVELARVSGETSLATLCASGGRSRA